jgi:hypothetical protein
MLWPNFCFLGRPIKNELPALNSAFTDLQASFLGFNCQIYFVLLCWAEFLNILYFGNGSNV